MSDDVDLFGLEHDAAGFHTTNAARGGAALGFIGVCLCFGALLGAVVGVFLAFWFLVFGNASIDVIGWLVFSQTS